MAPGQGGGLGSQTWGTRPFQVPGLSGDEQGWGAAAAGTPQCSWLGDSRSPFLPFSFLKFPTLFSPRISHPFPPSLFQPFSPLAFRAVFSPHISYPFLLTLPAPSFSQFLQFLFSPGTALLVLYPFAHTNPLLMPWKTGPARGRAPYLNSPCAGHIQQGDELRFPVCWELDMTFWQCGT